MDFPLSHYWQAMQPSLFPALREDVTEASDQMRRLITILDLVTPEIHLALMYMHRTMGRPPKERVAMAHAFLAMAILNQTSRRAIMDRLRCDPVFRRICGFESVASIPCESTFSNAFSEFAESEMFQRIHKRLVETKFDERIILHVARDATALAVREKVAPAEKTSPAKSPFGQASKKRGHPKKEEVREDIPATRLEWQMHAPLADILAELPCRCDWGCKTNSEGHKESWKGYKLHLDWADGAIPVTAILSSASLHDSQVAIPLEAMTSERITSLYSLMDKAYDATVIHFYVEGIGKVPIIDPLPRRGQEVVPLDPATAERYKQRTTAERGNARLKDDFGLRCIRVRGSVKVMAQCLCAVIALTAEQLIRHYF